MDPRRTALLFLVFATLSGLRADAARGPGHRPTGLPWSDVVQVPAFDPKLGELGAVHLTIDTFVRTEMRVENVGGAPEMVSANAFARLNVQLPGGAPAADIPYDVSELWMLPAFDGANDFGGASGRTARDSCRRTVKVLVTEPSDLLQFVGPPNAPGTVGIAVEALGLTEIVGGTAVMQNATIDAGVRVGVEYLLVAH